VIGCQFAPTSLIAGINGLGSLISTTLYNPERLGCWNGKNRQLLIIFTNTRRSDIAGYAI